jgi:hypothetical protein
MQNFNILKQIGCELVGIIGCELVGIIKDWIYERCYRIIFLPFLISSSSSFFRHNIDVPSLMFGCQDGRLEIWPGLVCLRAPVSILV